MALVVKDRVKETTATTGQGTLTLAGAVSGFQSFTSALSDGDTTYYAIFETSTGQWEVGLGTFTATGTTLARTTILESSNSGSAINLTAGAADVFITQPAEKAVYLDASGNVTFADNEKAIFGTGSDLEIYHDGSNSIIDDTGTGNLQLKTSAGDVDIYNSAGNLAAKFGGDTHLYTNGTEILRTQSSAIAVVGSVNKLSSATSGSLGTSAIRWDNVYADDMYVSGALIHNGDTNTKMEFSTDTINFDTGGSERLRITSGGYVGIGTTAPSLPLELSSTGTTRSGVKAQALVNDATAMAADVGGGIQFDGNYTTSGFHTTFAAIKALKENSTSGEWGADLAFYTRPNGSNLVEGMRIDSAGNVGIGTTSPASLLHVQETSGSADIRIISGITSTSSIYMGDTVDNDIGAIFYNQAGNYMRFQTNNSVRMHIDSSGNVGIGQTSPGAKLDVNGVILGESLQGDYDALSGTSPAPDADNADAFSLTMTGNTTFTFGSVTSGRSVGFCLQLTGNGGTVTWPASVDWAGGTAPDAPGSGETDILVFWTRDGGTTWYGMLAVDAAS